jgi:Reverse transcriptase (RNA-dependent DNA polymerase)
MLTQCALQSLPCTKPNSVPNSGIVGWFDHCDGLRKESLHWHHIWVDCGRPKDGIVAAIMRTTRKKYHTAVIQARKSQVFLKNEKIAEYYTNGNSIKFWREIKRISASGHPTYCNIIDDISTPEGIANAFRNVYAETFHADFVNTDDFVKLRSDLNNECLSENWLKFSPNDVVGACKRLKPDKKDSDMILNSYALMNASFLFYSLLCDLINAIFTHGHVPPSWRSGTIIPLLKSGNVSKCELTSYRPITISSLFGKVVDLLVYNRHYVQLQSSDMQFGFKQKHSTNHCTHVAKEVIAYYVNNGSDVFSCALDLQKAFDKVNLIKLFRKLHARCIPSHCLRVWLDLYYMLELRVLWNGCYSLSFVTFNGVKQGGICSAIFFSVYIDDLLHGLKLLSIGCFVGNIYYGCLAYADDIILLAPTLAALRLMLHYCSVFACDNDIVFNPVKSVCIKFSLHNVDVIQYTVLLQGSSLSWTNKIKHLGHILCSTLNDIDDITSQQNVFVSQFNYFIAKFNGISIALKVRLFMSYCESFYGSQLWDLQHVCIKCFDTVWRKAIRRLWQLPYKTHCNFLPVFANGSNFHTILCKRFNNFANDCFVHCNNLIKFISHVAASSQLHVFGKNVLHACYYQMSCIPALAVGACEMSLVRAGLLHVNGFTVPEVQDLLSFVCCS